MSEKGRGGVGASPGSGDRAFCWDTRCPTERVQRAKETQTSQQATRIGNRAHHFPLSTHTHARTDAHTHRHTHTHTPDKGSDDTKGGACSHLRGCSPLTRCSVVLSFLLPLFRIALFCQPYHSPPLQTPKILFISYFSKNKTEHKQGRREEGGWAVGGEIMTKEFA